MRRQRADQRAALEPAAGEPVPAQPLGRYGNKEELFGKAVDWYVQSPGAFVAPALVGRVITGSPVCPRTGLPACPRGLRGR